jgi:hypothetical protein
LPWVTTFVTPEMAKAAWEAMDWPSMPLVAVAFSQAGESVSAKTLHKWCQIEWRRIRNLCPSFAASNDAHAAVRFSPATRETVSRTFPTAEGAKVMTVELGDITERNTTETHVVSEAIMRAAIKFPEHGDLLVREQPDTAAKLIGAASIAHKNVVCSNVQVALVERRSKRRWSAVEGQPLLSNRTVARRPTGGDGNNVLLGADEERPANPPLSA